MSSDNNCPSCVSLRVELDRAHDMLDAKYPRSASDAETDVEYWRTRGGEHFTAFLGISEELTTAKAEIARLHAERDSPQIADFLQSVKMEALHQRSRWGSEHDAGKAPADWFWLLGYLSGKALHAACLGNTEKAMHHTVSSAAALMNWHAALSGAHTVMRPGIEEPAP